MQAGSDLNTQLEALQAEKETLRKVVSEKDCELISTKGLIQEKELLLSQEAEKRVKEVQELQGKLLEKVLKGETKSWQRRLVHRVCGTLP